MGAFQFFDLTGELSTGSTRGGIPLTTITGTLLCARHTVYKALGQTPVGSQEDTAQSRQRRRPIFYNTFTRSLRSRYDFPRPFR